MRSIEKIIIGIDISKASLDICVYGKGKQTHFVIDNKTTAIRKFLTRFSKEKQVLVGMENTGRYNWNLYEVLVDYSFKVYVISPLHLKKSLGLVRGKNDKVDAMRIALFTDKHSEELSLWEAPRKQISQLKVLLTERNQRIKMKRQLLCTNKDYSLMKSMGLSKSLVKLNLKLIEAIDKQIKKIESQIEKLISCDQSLMNLSRLIRTVPGVGKVLCWTMLAKTNEFKSIKDPRKMACYAGVVPFEFQSGTSIYRKPRVSFFADKTLKSILHLAAMSAIRLNNDLRSYYLRKVKEGKNKMSVLNAVRNKIIHRIFAVVNNQKIYTCNLDLS